MDERIKHMGRNVYVVCGKVIEFRDGMFDMSEPKDQQELIDIAGELYQGEFDPASYGPYTVCVLLPKRKEYGPDRYGMSEAHMSHMPEDVRANLRKEFPEYAGEI